MTANPAATARNPLSPRTGATAGMGVGHGGPPSATFAPLTATARTIHFAPCLPVMPTLSPCPRSERAAHRGPHFIPGGPPYPPPRTGQVARITAASAAFPASADTAFRLRAPA